MAEFLLMNFFDYGSRQSAFSADARSLDADLLLRKCVFSRLEEVNEEEIFNAIANETSAFIFYILKASNIFATSTTQKIMQLERAIIRREVTIPTYLTEENTSTKELYEQIKISAVFSEMLRIVPQSISEILKNAFFGTGYHIVVSGSQPKPLPDLVFHNIQKNLSSSIRASVPAKNGPTPVVAFVAHYDAIGLAPALSFGTDSNGSGVIALLELARIFSSLKKKNDLTYNVMFLLTSGGKLNYLGVKKYLEERLDESDDSFQRSLAGAVCLDTIGRGDMMYLHVSKVPKDGSFGQIFLENLTSSGKRKVSLKTKKINLSDDFLAWEHERFNIRRLSGLTLSSVESHLSAERSTISDVLSLFTVKSFIHRFKNECSNTKIMWKGLSRHLRNFHRSCRQVQEVTSTWLEVLSLNGMLVEFNEVVSALHEDDITVFKEGSEDSCWLGVESRIKKSCGSNIRLMDSVLRKTVKAMVRGNELLMRVLFIFSRSDYVEPEILLIDDRKVILKAFNLKICVFVIFLFFFCIAPLFSSFFIILQFPLIIFKKTSVVSLIVKKIEY
nr:EOG090X02MW [Artemia franciscana]